MNTIKLQGVILEVRKDLFLQDGTISLGVLRDNYVFFQRISNPLADKKVKSELEKITKEFTDKIKENTDFPADVKELLMETDKSIYEADKRSVIENALIQQTTEDELEQLCKSFFVDVSKIDFSKLNVLEISDAINEIKKKQLKDSEESLKESQ